MTTMTNEARKETVLRLAIELPPLLSKPGETWKPDVRNLDDANIWLRIVRAEDEASITIYVERWQNEGKLSARGNWPKLAAYGERSSETTFEPRSLKYNDTDGKHGFPVNIALSKTSAVIAREIERRVLARYLPLYAEALAQKVETVAYRARQLSLGVELARLAGSTPPTSDDRTSFNLKLPEDSGSGDVTVYGGKSVEIHLRSLDPATAKRVLAALKAEG